MECIGKIAAVLLLLLSPVQWQVGQRSFAPSTPGCTSELPTAVANLSFWLSADCYTNSSGCTYPADGTTLTTSWYDQSGSGKTWAPSASSSCVFHTSQINGKPAIHFDGSTCYFIVSSGLSFSATQATGFAVFANGNTSAKHTIIGGNGHSAAYWSCAATPVEQGLDSQQIAQLGYGTAACDTSWHQIDYVYNYNTSLGFRIDGSTDAAQGVTDTDQFSQPPAVIGENYASSDELMNGYIAEVFMFNGAVGSTDVSKLECYLKNKYGI